MTMTSLWHEMDTMQIQMNQIAYECRICEHKFTSPIQLTVHCIVLHGALPCADCLKLFINEQSLNGHIRAIHNENKHTCSDCANEFPSEKDLYFHLVRVHYKKQCQLCDALVSFDECQNHMETLHKITNSTTIRLNIGLDHQKQFHCQLCQDNKSVNRLEKLFFHFLYFHKCSLQSLIQCILNDNEIDSLRSTENCDDDTLAKCSTCGSFYTWSIPKNFHNIYCLGFIHCAKCDHSFEDQDRFVQHLEKCVKKVPEIDFCDDCNAADKLDLHLKNVHNFSTAVIGSKVSNLMNSRNHCQFCGRNLSSEANDLSKLIEHFRILHKFNVRAILSRLNKRQGGQELKVIQDCSSKRSAEGCSGILTIVKHDENADFQYSMDFDAKQVKCVYSSGSDYDSSESDNCITRPPSKSYQCDFCESRTKSKFVHVMHMHKRHGFELKTPEFRCNVCQKNFKSNRSLKKHNENIHHKRRGNEKRFKCSFCTFGCNGKGKMRQHISEHVEASYHPCTSKAIGFNCKFCHFIFWTKEKLSEHQLCRHSDRISETYLLCSVCYSAFNNLATLRSHLSTRHMEHHHVDGNAYQCMVCRIVLFSIDGIRLHMEELHPDYRSIYCAKANCAQIASTEDELSEHWTNEHAKSLFQCLQCFKVFERKEFVQNHMVRSHAKLRKTMEIQ